MRDDTDKMSVLLVEDDPLQTRLVRVMLQAEESPSYQLSSVESLADAVSRLSPETGELSPDVLLVDLNLPDSSGVDTVRRLRAAIPSTPLVVITGSDDDVGRASVQAGAQDYLPKAELSSTLLTRTLLYSIDRADREAELERRVDERTSQLQKAVEDLEAFAYTITHDLRTPLRAIGGLAELLQMDSAGALDERGRNYLARIEAAAATMDQVIEDLLEIGRIGRWTLDRTTFDLGELVRDSFETLGRITGRSGWRFHCEQPIRVDADPELTRLIVRNLVDNAWKFSAPRDEAVFRLTVEPDGWIALRDNGVGFDPALSGRMFDPFERLHTGEEFPGSGVGLAGVRRALQRHGGAIRADGCVGEGAVFYFHFGPGERSTPDVANDLDR